MIVFVPAAASGLRRIAATGGPVTTVTSLDAARGENSHRWPQFLPDGRRFIYLVRSDKPHVSGIYLGSLDRPLEKTQLTENWIAGAYSRAHGNHPAYLYSIRQQALLAQPWDIEHPQLLGKAVPVPGAQLVSYVSAFGRASLSVSDNGTILFGTGSDHYQLTWLNREGKALNTVGQPDRYASLRISPDGKRIAVTLTDAVGVPDIWLLDFARGIPSRLTFGSAFGTGIWSPDGQHISYHLLNNTKIFERDLNNPGQENTLLQSQNTLYLCDWSSDGRYFVYSQTSPEGRYELWLLPTTGDRKPAPFLRTPFDALQGQFSPDSKWIAYTSNESGRQEIYVQSFPSGGAKWLVSSGGGTLARWRRDGKEILYRALDGKLMVASVRNAPGGLEFGTPGALFRTSEPQGQFSYPYDISPDGQRILALVPGEVAGDAASLSVIVNWDTKSKP